MRCTPSSPCNSSDSAAPRSKRSKPSPGPCRAAIGSLRGSARRTPPPRATAPVLKAAGVTSSRSAGCPAPPARARHAAPPAAAPHAPTQVGRAQRQAGGVGRQAAARAARRSAQPAPTSNGSVYSGSMMNTLPTAEGVVAEGQAELGAVDRHRVEQRVRDQRQPHRQPPAPPLCPLACSRATSAPKRQREQRQPERRVRLGAVQHHVADRVAVVDQHVQIGQRAGHRAPQRGLPGRRAAAHRGHADGGAERDLRERIHGGAFLAGTYSVTPSELLELKGRAAKLFTQAPPRNTH
jgi:hypothetical protein